MKLFKAILWPIKKVIFFPLKILLYTTLIFIFLVLFFQYRQNYDVTISLLSEYVSNLDSQQQSFLYDNLPDPLSVLTKPKEVTQDDFQNVRTFLKYYLQAGRFPGIGGKALSPQASSLCRGGLS